MESEQKQDRRNRILWGVYFLFFLLLSILVSYVLAFRGKIYRGVTLGGINVGGLTTAEVSELVGKKTTQTPHAFRLVSGGKSWVWNWDQLGVVVEIQSSIDRAFAVGRTGLLANRLAQQKEVWTKGLNVPIDWSWNDNEVESAISSISAELAKIPEEPSVTITNGAVAVSPGEDGVILDTEKLKKMLADRLNGLGSDDQMTIPLTPAVIKLTQTEQDKVKKQAQAFLGKSINFGFKDDGEEKRWTLKDNDLVQFLSLTPPDGSVDTTKIASYAATLAQGIDRDPENAAFQFTQTEASGAGKVSVFRPGKDGLTLDQTETGRDIAAAVRTIMVGETPQTISLTMTRTPPAISTESVNDLGIRELLGRGVSYFAGSIPGRIHNIALAASRLNGTLVTPGETFSFDQTVGDISAATGYQQAYIIKEGRTVLGDGGGVCQVSTTLFRSVLAAGLPVVERWAHAYRVHYYEENSPVGLDATVFSPSVDFKFKNDTPGYVLVQTTMDQKAQKLTFELYGTSDGRTVTIGKSRVWDVTPPPPDLYQDDPTLPAGVVKQVDFSAWGAKVSFDWTVMRGSDVLQKRTFYSNFQPWQAVYLKGTKN